MSPDQAFGDPVEPPDAEFGCFAAIYGPPGSEHAAAALLRADIGAGRTGRGKAMPMYVGASRQDVARCAVSVIVWLIDRLSCAMHAIHVLSRQGHAPVGASRPRTWPGVRLAAWHAAKVNGKDADVCPNYWFCSILHAQTTNRL